MKEKKYPDLLNHLYSCSPKVIAKHKFPEPDKLAASLVDVLRFTFGGMIMYIPKEKQLQTILNSDSEKFQIMIFKEIKSAFSEALQADYGLTIEQSDSLAFSLLESIFFNFSGSIIYITKGKLTNFSDTNKQIYTEYLKGKPVWKLASELRKTFQTIYKVINIERKKARIERNKKLGCL